MNKSHVIIRNRAALTSDAGWIHIVPKGELPNAEAKIVQVLDDAALDSILANITAAKNRLGDKWPGIYAGREHFIYDDTQDSAALGWFKEFEKRADGIWAKDDGLTPAGQTAVMNREYKFTSFVADRADLKKVEGSKYRVMAIETVGFTNQANGKELLTPIVNRSQKVMNGDYDGHPFRGNQFSDGSGDGDLVTTEIGGSHQLSLKDEDFVHVTEIDKPVQARARDVMRDLWKKGKVKEAHNIFGKLAKGGFYSRNLSEDQFKTVAEKNFGPVTNRNNSAGASASAASNQQQHNERTKTMKSIAQKLGLAAEASEDAILAEVTKIQNRVTELTPLADENTKLKNRITEADTAAVNALLAAHGVKDAKVLNRLKPVIAGIEAHADRVAALNDFGFKAESKETAAAGRVLNRSNGQTAQTETAPDEAARATKIRNRASELQSTRKLSFDAAWAQASQEVQ